MIVTCPGCQSHYHHPSGPQVRARCSECDARFVISGAGNNYFWRDVPTARMPELPTPTPMPLAVPLAVPEAGPMIGMDDPIQADSEDKPDPVPVEASDTDSLKEFAAGFGGSSAPIDEQDFGDPDVVAHYEEIEPGPEVAGSGIPGPPSHDSGMVDDYPGDEILIEPPTLDRLGLTPSTPAVEDYDPMAPPVSRPATREGFKASAVQPTSQASVRAPLWVLLAGAGTTAAGYHGAPFLKAWLDRSVAFQMPDFFMQPPIAALLSGCLGLLIGAGVARWMQRS